MSTHHNQKVQHALFAHPISANIEMKDVEHLLAHLGAEIEDKGDKFSVTLNGQTRTIHRPHQHTLTKDAVAEIRDFLTDCGVSDQAA